MKMISKHFEALDTGQGFGSYNRSYRVLCNHRVSRESSCFVREHPEGCSLKLPKSCYEDRCFKGVACRNIVSHWYFKFTAIVTFPSFDHERRGAGRVLLSVQHVVIVMGTSAGFYYIKLLSLSLSLSLSVSQSLSSRFPPSAYQIQSDVYNSS